jgi:hypothetical protein
MWREEIVQALLDERVLVRNGVGRLLRAHSRRFICRRRVGKKCGLTRDRS